MSRFCQEKTKMKTEKGRKCDTCIVNTRSSKFQNKKSNEAYHVKVQILEDTTECLISHYHGVDEKIQPHL